MNKKTSGVKEKKKMQNEKKIKITIYYRDDKEENFICNDYPSIGDCWIWLCMPDLERIVIPKDAIAKIKYEII